MTLAISSKLSQIDPSLSKSTNFQKKSVTKIDDFLNFKDVRNSLKNIFSPTDSTKIPSLGQLISKAKNGTLNPVELLSVQESVSKNQLRVELLSKIAEGLNGTVKRIQQGG